MRIRLNSFLAQCGLGSRRACEKLILAGDVSINGEPARDLAIRVDPKSDIVRVGNRPVQPARKIYLAFNKPAGFVTSREEQGSGARTIYDLLPPEFENLFYVGRLDRDTEGLLLLTNDGEWAQRVAHPRHEVEKLYEAEVRGSIGPREIERARRGVRDEGELLRAKTIRVLGAAGGRQRLELVLTEGRKREVRRLLRRLGAPVVMLKRLAVGGVKLGALRPGAWRALSLQEVARFRN